MVWAEFSVDDVCEDEIFSPVNLSNAGNTIFNKYNWDFGDGQKSSLETPDKFYSKAGTYTVLLTTTNNSNCSFDTSHTLTVYPKPKTGFTILGAPLDIFNSTISVTDQSVGAIDWTYFISDNSIVNSATFTHSFKDSGLYAIKQFLRTDKGCIDSLTKSIFVSYRYLPWIPNAFSPNNDGNNDEFGIVGTGIIATEMMIFNRWGEKLFHSQSGNQKWDGTYKGATVENGVYYYSIKVVTYTSDIHYYHGTLNVLR